MAQGVVCVYVYFRAVQVLQCVVSLVSYSAVLSRFIVHRPVSCRLLCLSGSVISAHLSTGQRCGVISFHTSQRRGVVSSHLFAGQRCGVAVC